MDILKTIRKWFRKLKNLKRMQL